MQILAMHLRDYAEGSVVFKSAGVADDSGYFMALSSVKAGVKIEDTSSPTTQWIKLLIVMAKDLRKRILLHQNLTQTVSSIHSTGDQVAYLKGRYN